MRAFPGGFSDETYVDWERDYKWQAHLRWQEQLSEASFRHLLDDRQFARSEPWSTRLSVLPLTAFALLFVLAVGNVISTVLICGAGLCPDVPAGYLIFNDNLRLTDLAQSP